MTARSTSLPADSTTISPSPSGDQWPAVTAGRRGMEAGGSAVDVIVETMNGRYGDARRRLSRSPHALEINDQAFRRARDIMIGAAVDFQAKVTDILVELEARAA